VSTAITDQRFSNHLLAYSAHARRTLAALRQADQIRTDIANVEIGLEMIMAQLARMPTRKELWRAALTGILGGSALTIALAFAFWG